MRRHVTTSARTLNHCEKHDVCSLALRKQVRRRACRMPRTRMQASKQAALRARGLSGLMCVLVASEPQHELSSKRRIIDCSDEPRHCTSHARIDCALLFTGTSTVRGSSTSACTFATLLLIRPSWCAATSQARRRLCCTSTPAAAQLWRCRPGALIAQPVGPKHVISHSHCEASAAHC